MHQTVIYRYSDIMKSPTFYRETHTLSVGTGCHYHLIYVSKGKVNFRLILILEFYNLYFYIFFFTEQSLQSVHTFELNYTFRINNIGLPVQKREFRNTLYQGLYITNMSMIVQSTNCNNCKLINNCKKLIFKKIPPNMHKQCIIQNSMFKQFLYMITDWSMLYLCIIFFQYFQMEQWNCECVVPSWRLLRISVPDVTWQHYLYSEI